MTAPTFRTDPVWLDAQYNNRALVPEHGQFLQRWAERSGEVRSQWPAWLDERYGDGPHETLDVFLPRQQGRRRGAPVLVFIHGGYWRALDKSDHSFVAPGFTEAGAAVVVPNYALCPQVTVGDIAMQMARAVAWAARHAASFGGDARRIVVAGHSAGGHLAAMLLACDWRSVDAALSAGLVRRAVSVSGLFDLEPLRHTPFLQRDLRLTAQDALALSPAAMPAPHGELLAVVGGDESGEFLRQNRLIRRRWGAQAVTLCRTLRGRHHFSALDALADPGHWLHRQVRGWLTG